MTAIKEDNILLFSFSNSFPNNSQTQMISEKIPQLKKKFDFPKIGRKRPAHYPAFNSRVSKLEPNLLSVCQAGRQLLPFDDDLWDVLPRLRTHERLHDANH